MLLNNLIYQNLIEKYLMFVCCHQMRMKLYIETNKQLNEENVRENTCGKDARFSRMDISFSFWMCTKLCSDDFYAHDKALVICMDSFQRQQQQ